MENTLTIDGFRLGLRMRTDGFCYIRDLVALFPNLNHLSEETLRNNSAAIIASTYATIGRHVG